jgi:RimJ/RimL family protein N-acetyltransferase
MQHEDNDMHLELLTDGDWETVAAWNAGKPADFITQWAGPGYGSPLTADRLREYNAEYNSPGGSQFIYIIMLDGAMIGTVQLLRIDRVAGTAVVGRFLIGDEALRGKGLGRQALQLISQKGFQEFGLKLLVLNVYEHNAGAIACYEKTGYRKTAHTTDAVQAESGFWSSYRMELLHEDFTVMKPGRPQPCSTN